MQRGSDVASAEAEPGSGFGNCKRPERLPRGRFDLEALPAVSSQDN
jgi:hypothetical protein